MKYVKFSGGNGYCGCDFEEYIAFPDDTTKVFLDDMLQDKIFDNADAFSYVATGWGDDFESDEEREAYFEDCEGVWEYVTKEEFEENNGEEW